MINVNVVLNKLYPIEKLLEIKDKKKNLKCPSGSHADKKPSSHIYENHVFCFACSKSYYVTDIIEFKGLNKSELYNEILEQYTKEDLEELCKDVIVKNKEVKKVKKVKNEDFLEFTRRYFKS